MKKYITIAALLAAGTASANAWNIIADFETAPVKAGNCWSGDYTFTFTLNDMTFLNDEVVLAYYRGSAINDTYGYNAIVLTETATEGEYTLTVGRGRANDTVDDATGIGQGTSFTFANGADDKRAFTTSIVLGTTYTLSVTGASQAMTPTLTWDDGSEALASYNGNMNGDAAFTVATIPVPEPSAFGLLAGVGALALVASRRRRR
ncbi:MAG: PEP-CTERM sorting domain-containing protein [Opitutales bacterium]|nr:PEP-CTERM sorting domain-containing protein [Opitutales bacterium]